MFKSMYKNIRYRMKILSSLKPYYRGIYKFWVMSFAVSLLSMAAGLITPQFYRVFIDEVIICGKFSLMLTVTVGYLGAYVLNIILDHVSFYAEHRLNDTLLYRVKRRVWNGFFRLPFTAYENVSIGELKTRLEDDTSRVTSFTGSQSIGYVTALLSMLLNCGILFLIDVRLAVYSMAVIPLTFIPDGALSKREEVLNESNRKNDESMASHLHESIRGWREVKALGLYKKQERQLVKHLKNYAMYFAVWINYWTARTLIIPKLKNDVLMRFGLYFFGGLLVIKGELEVGELLVFITYYGNLSGAVGSLSGTDAALISEKTYTDRLMKSLKEADESEARDGVKPGYDRTVRLENVSFAYSQETGDVIRNFSLTVKRGERVAIVGKSGAGKTTVLKLICGMITPREGRVTFSGVDVKEIDLASMHSRIGYVMQDSTLFNTTIRENLMYVKENATEEELNDALSNANVREFVDSLPDGLDTVIGERGIKLSGGQRQRIVLARLFLRDVDVFIFDEATSALDQYSENMIQKVISSIGRDKTVIVVAHRESSVSFCDRRVYL